MPRVLTFLRVVDEAGRLSITNISIIGLLIKILSEPHPAPADCVALLVAVANYLGKRIVQYHESKVQKPSLDLNQLGDAVTKLQNDLADQNNKISSLSIAASMRPPLKPLGSR